MKLKNIIVTHRFKVIDGNQVEQMILSYKDNYEEIDAFTLFIDRLMAGDARKTGKPVSANTLTSYRTNVAKFLDYLVEANVLNSKNLPEHEDVIAAIKAYPEFLVNGVNSTNKLAADLAKKLCLYKSNISSKSSNLHYVPVNEFLTLSEEIYRATHTKTCREMGVDFPDEQYIPMFKAVWVRKELSKKQKNHWKNNTLIGGVLRDYGGVKVSSVNVIISQEEHDLPEFDEDKAFPLEYALKQVNSKTLSLRNKCLFALLHASGLRLSEALCLQWHHIDLINRKVFLTSVSSRGLTSQQAKQCIHSKGRKTKNNRVFLYTDCEDVFWDALSQYMKSSEYCPDGSHDFIFVLNKGINKGKPCVLSLDSESRSCQFLTLAFKKASKDVLVPDYEQYAPHSCRHAYCTYLVNDIPHIKDGELKFGFPPVTVQKIVGHSKLSTTLLYVRGDENEMIKSEAEARQVLQIGGHSDAEISLLKQLIHHKKMVLEFTNKINKSEEKGIPHV